jgi:hypothetical protein
MKFRSLLFITLVMIVASACGVDDLESRLDKVENALGTNEPLAINFATKNANDMDVVEKTAYLFKAKGYYDYMEKYSDDEIYVYVERFSDVNWNEGAWLEFYYNPLTGEATDAQAGVYFYDQFGNWVNPGFYDGYTGNTVTATVNKLDFASGTVSVSIAASTTDVAENNEFSGKPMTSTFTFKGKIESYDYSGL